jgi:hypothetical protein
MCQGNREAAVHHFQTAIDKKVGSEGQTIASLLMNTMKININPQDQARVQ